ncbi:MAG: response regulator [Burkholderiales bacterium]|nr:response regulator [Burkholderiales bacterium]
MTRRVLIIEDDDDARETLAELLRLDAHQVSVATSGEEGVGLASSLAPEFVLIDIGLPDIDGYEVARRLRSNPATSRLRLIAITGYGMQEDRRSALAAGFDEHLAKPVELESLKALLSELPVAA